MGARLEAREGRFPPFTVQRRRARRHRVPAPRGERPGQVLRADRRDAGRRVHHRRGARAEPRPHRAPAAPRPRAVPGGGRALTVSQVDEIELDEVVVPGDPSSAAFMVAAAMLVPGSRVVVSGMGLNWTRTAFFRIAERMKAVVVCELEEPGTESDPEPLGELDVASGPLEGTEVGADEVPLAIDELTLVALLGASPRARRWSAGPRAAAKESDRIAAVVSGLRGLGADIEETPDGFVVRGDGSPLRGGTIDSHGDHRLAMLGAVAGLASRGGRRGARHGRRGGLLPGLRGRPRGAARESSHDRRDRRPRGRGQEHRGARAGAGARLPLPRLGRDVPRGRADDAAPRRRRLGAGRAAGARARTTA